MFSLIIAIISIALVVVLVAATQYHGDTLTQGRIKADSSGLITGAQQVAGAAVMYQSMQGSKASDVASLVSGKYLTSLPNVAGTALALDTTNNYVTSTVTNGEVCTQINKSANPSLTDTAAAAVTAIGNLPYACISESKLFQFKY